MTPLVPELIGNELNLIIALVLGIGFGFVLEQAGFSSTRKLAGLFYGYDFVVLRVFFTAAVTAMTGLIIFSYFGILNLDLVFINPMFLKSALLGGAIMGAGFIIGGFCPGTSVCAAGIGKIDGIFFIGGILLGAFIYAEAYPLFQGIYEGGYLGDLLVYESLGISKGLFAFLLIVGAIGAFIATSIIENRVNKVRTQAPIWRNNRYSPIIAVSVIIGFILIFMPDKKSQAISIAAGDNFSAETVSAATMTADELAFRIIERDENLRLIDVRSADEYKKSHLPTAVNIPFDELANLEWREALKNKDKDNVFYSSEQDVSQRAAELSKMLGDNPVNYVLKGGMVEFEKSFTDVKKPERFTDRQARATYQFRSDARDKLIAIGEEEGKAPPPRKEIRKVQGGCG
ncbi:YeeE/YedE family protein [bacterium]|nr:YeeE/YedE family protein [bacterium]